jgi:protein-tyrosine phosphatase
MGTFIDLHCHWLSGLDDGAPDQATGRNMLARLEQLGFARVVATPHMRPGLFDTTRDQILTTFEQQKPNDTRLELDVSAEHYFDDVVFARLRQGQALPYPGNKAALLEFYAMDLPPQIDRLLSQLKREGLTPVIAHPERYQTIWKAPKRLEQMIDAGAMTLLDAGALVGKYGKTPQRVARQLLDEGLYHAACSDAHRTEDLNSLEEAMHWISEQYGAAELDALFSTGPAQILEGAVSKS